MSLGAIEGGYIAIFWRCIFRRRGSDAEAEAARIYAISYGKDPDFYDFYRAMQSYRQTFQNGEGASNIILSPQNAYLEKFRNGI